MYVKKIQRRVGKWVSAILFALASVNAVAQSCVGEGPMLDMSSNTANTTDSKNLNMVLDFIKARRYTGWAADPYIRPTGDIYHTTEGQLIDGTTHHRVRIYYSKHVEQWLREGRPSLQEWVDAGRAESCYLPDGATIVKEMYKTVPPIYPDEDPVIGWSVMTRKNGASADGWFWTIYFQEEFRSMDTMGTFAYSFCLTCHASTEGQNTFADLGNMTGEDALTDDGRAIVEIANPIFFHDAMLDSGRMIKHRSTINPDFEKLYSDSKNYPYSATPKYDPKATGPLMPSTDFDHVWNRDGDQSYLTSDNCIGCHDATALVDTQIPNMLVKRKKHDELTGKTKEELLNLSVYGEWRASPMGMAGRDPIFFAQLESEINTYPEDATKIQNTCLSCHGAMGQRQHEADTQSPFSLDMVSKTQGPGANYGALARDGISCMICHQMDPKTVNAETNTGKFKRGQWDEIYASTKPGSDPGGEIRTWPMKHALGFTPEYNPYVNQSEMCGTCHTIELHVGHPEVKDAITGQADRFHSDKPVLDDGTVLLSEAHEQDTFLEWYYSQYQNSNPDLAVNPATAKTCQDCHMNGSLQGNDRNVNYKVANVENTSWPKPPAKNLASAFDISVPHRPDVGRHTLFGMNLFVLNMYDQFGDTVFGLEPDTNPPMGTKNNFEFAIENGDWQIKNETAEVSLLSLKRNEQYLLADVSVMNKAGHRLPSGVGFRRAWLSFEVLNDKGETIWGSGVTDDNGVMVGADRTTPLESEFTVNPDQLQPHWEVISDQDQVQIYEERYVNRYGDQIQLNTSFLGIGRVVKDNRLLPQGYHYNFIHNKLHEATTEAQAEKWMSLLPDYDLPSHQGAMDPREDPRYTSGSGMDVVSYKIPLSQVPNAARVKVSLNYQSIPPYYLRDRFARGAGGDQTQRLYYLVGHLNVENTSIDGWKIVISEADASVPMGSTN